MSAAADTTSHAGHVTTSRTTVPLRLVAALALASTCAVLVTRAPEWGIHRDEFLYFAMAEHFDLFRMQFPPMIAAIAGTGRALFGDSVLAARVPASLGGGALVFVVLLLIRRLGGGSVACVTAWLAMLAAPLFVRSAVLMQPVVYDQLWATITLASLTLAAHEENPRWWLGVGIGLGLGALTKFSVAFTGVSVAVAVLLTPQLRLHFPGRWPWVAAITAALLAVPSLSGQVLHDWPFLQQAAALRASQLDRVTPLAFLIGQAMMLAGALWCVIPGAAAAARGTARDRVPAIAALTMLAVMLALHGKPYYAGSTYPVLVATGALAIERAASRRRWLGKVVPACIAAVAILLWPLGVPSLSPEQTIRYTERLGIAETVTTNQGVTLALPQDYADMLGWRELADAVGQVVAQLPAAQRTDLTLVGGNYGEAGALAFHRRRAGLPYAVSVRGDFWAWGPGAASGRHVILVGDTLAADGLRMLYDTVTVARVLRDPLRVPEEQHVVIYRASSPRGSLQDVWPSLGPKWD